MSCRIAYDAEENVAALFDSTTGIAFGEVFEGCEKDCCTGQDVAERFLTWTVEHHGDPRRMPGDILAGFRRRFHDEVGRCVSEAVKS